MLLLRRKAGSRRLGFSSFQTMPLHHLVGLRTHHMTGKMTNRGSLCRMFATPAFLHACHRCDDRILFLLVLHEHTHTMCICGNAAHSRTASTVAQHISYCSTAPPRIPAALAKGSPTPDAACKSLRSMCALLSLLHTGAERAFPLQTS
jgi:hypothetical protein